MVLAGVAGLLLGCLTGCASEGIWDEPSERGDPGESHSGEVDLMTNDHTAYGRFWWEARAHGISQDLQREIETIIDAEDYGIDPRTRTEKRILALLGGRVADWWKSSANVEWLKTCRLSNLLDTPMPPR